MNSTRFSSELTKPCHVLAMPLPGRGHINPMMNLCKVLVSKSNHILISFVITEEWLGFIGSDPKSDRIRFCTIPNVLPSELVRGANMVEFTTAVWTKMEAPVECILDKLDPPANLIMADTFLVWAISMGNRRTIPVAAFWPMSAMYFLVWHHFHLFEEKGHFPVNLLEKGDDPVDYIPGVSPTLLSDLPAADFSESFETKSFGFKKLLDSISTVRKAKYLLFPSIYELETKSIDTLKEIFPFPIYPVGPAIPYLELASNSYDNKHDYLQWLDRQPKNSVLYISLGSFYPVSSAQIDEIAGGLNDSGVRFFWVVRNETSKIKESCNDQGFLVPWCDQLRVLCHPSIGGFWSHCGWSSVREGIFAGIPFLAFPLIADQRLNSTVIVEDLKIGWRLRKKQFPLEDLVTRSEISWLVKKFMDLTCEEVKEMRERAKELKEKCQQAIDKNGSSETSISSFINNITQISTV